jgi:starch synthase
MQMVNIMKGAVQTSQAVTTVSESYAWEITQESHGAGLHAVLARASRRLTGIVNGIDASVWDPATDAHLPFNFSASDMRGKKACKAMLRRELGLPEPSFDVHVPLVGFVGRLDPHKGSDVLIDALPGLISLDCQVRAL